MDDIVYLFVVFFVFKALGGTLKSLSTETSEMISEETDKELPYLPSIMGKPYCKHQLQYGSPFIYIAQKSNSFNKDLYVLRNLLMAIFLILPGLLLVINSFSKAVSAMADFIASTLFLYPHTNFAPVIDLKCSTSEVLASVLQQLK